MSSLTMDVAIETVALAAPFRISGHVFESARIAVVTLDNGTHRGRGEAAGVYYTGDDADRIEAELERIRPEVEHGIDRAALQQLIGPGGARNALDCALWELEAQSRGKPVWELAGVSPPRPLVTTFTLGADSPERMAEGARALTGARAIKVKLDGNLDEDQERVRAVRAARPDAWLGVDANQGYVIERLAELIETLSEAKVSLLEQPLARGRESDLAGLASPIPIAADESALGLADVDGLVGRFDMVNIKLDKCGGLTEGLAMAARARELGLDVMVGNMVGTSLAMAPAFILGQSCDVVDLDGPTFLVRDREPSVTYADGTIWCDDKVWGARSRP